MANDTSVPKEGMDGSAASVEPPASLPAAAVPGGQAPALPLAARLESLFGQFMSLYADLTAGQGLSAFERRLRLVLCDPHRSVASGEQLASYKDIAPGVQVGFEQGSSVLMDISRKQDFSRSPESCLNTIELRFRGSSRWLTLELTGDWDDLRGAQNFQFGFYGRPDRDVDCRAVLRLPAEGGDSRDIELARFRLSAEAMNFNRKGSMQPLAAVSISEPLRPPKLIIFFDTRDALSLRLDYLTAYFA